MARMNPKERTTELLAVATRVALRDGFASMRRDAIAAEAGVTGALVTCRLGTMPELRRAVMRHAIKNRILGVVAQGLALGDKHALKAPEDVRREAAAWLGRV